MLLLLPFLHLAKRLPQKTFLPSWAYELGLLAALLCRESIYHFFEFVGNWSISGTIKLATLDAMPFKRWCSLQAEVGDEGAARIPQILDLPELALECILAKLSPAELCTMAGVCRYLRERCTDDHLWRRHVSKKWSRVMGEAAYEKWELQVAEREVFRVTSRKKMGWLDCVWPLPWPKQKINNGRKPYSPADSLFSLYTALENGRFTFPAQIYNRENGNAGFLMSCYDAEISYSSRKNKFYARYPPHGKRVPAIEEVPWERVRAPSSGAPAHDLHISVCLSDLSPGDHIEIQWRRDKEFPYGWWYGIVGHLETCGSGEEHHCCCSASDTIALEFNHFAPGSRRRRRRIDRREHREEGDEDVGFYGGIRKVQKKEEISMWMQLRPAEVVV